MRSQELASETGQTIYTTGQLYILLGLFAYLLTFATQSSSIVPF
jgi:hypothetical protein